MRKNLLQLSALMFMAALSGMLACSSDPNGGGGCGQPPPKAPLNCRQGEVEKGGKCVKYQKKDPNKKPATPDAPTTI